MKSKKMKRIYELIADMSIKRIEAEKGTALSEDTYKMLSFLQGLYEQLFRTEENTLKDYERIVVETYEDDPKMIAEVTADDVTPADGYRVRLTPAKD